MSASTPLRYVHLIRHGEVENPDHVVYADLDGFGLSAQGRIQAAAAAEHLAGAPIRRIVSSPLQRAQETAAFVAAAHPGVDVQIDERLTEWRLGSRWAGTVWEDLPERFPGELEAYLAHPEALAFSPESLEDAAIRFAAAVEAAHATTSDGDVVVVSHQDPVQAGRLHLTGGTYVGFHDVKPGHASVITLAPPPEPQAWWRPTGWWEPDQGTAFPPVSD